MVGILHSHGQLPMLGAGCLSSSSRALCSALRELTLLVQSSLEVLVLVPASELSQGQPSASEGQESENKCPFPPSVCGTGLRYVIHVSLEYPRGIESQQ